MFSLIKMAFLQNLTPIPTDARSPLRKRVREKFAVVSLGNHGAKVGACTFAKGEPTVEDVVFLAGDGPDALYPRDLMSAIKDRSPSKMVVLGFSLKGTYQLSPRAEHSDLAALEGCNGDMRDPQHYIQSLPNLDSKKTLKGSIDRALVQQIIEAFRLAGFEVIRCEIPPIAILNRMLGDPDVSTSPEGSVRIPIVCDQGMLFALTMARNEWLQFRSPTLITRSATNRKAEEDDEIYDTLHSCCRSLDQAFSTRSGEARPGRYSFTVVDTGTPALFDRVSRAGLQLAAASPGMEIVVERYTDDPHAELLSLVHDLEGQK